MSDLISRQAAIDAVNIADDNGQILTVLDVLDVLKALPAVQQETATITIGRTTMWYECAACGEPVDLNDNYCRKCGRKLIHD